MVRDGEKQEQAERGSKSRPWQEHVCVKQGEALIILAAFNAQHKSPLFFSPRNLQHSRL